MEAKQKYLIHFSVSESFKTTINSLQNSKSLKVKVLEIRWRQHKVSVSCWYQTSQ